MQNQKPIMNFLSVFSLIFFLGLSCTNESERKKIPKAMNGFLDLRNWDFNSNEVLKLDGEWEFYWKQLYKYEDFQSGNTNLPKYFSVPKTWNGFDWNGEILKGNGFATYRLKVNTGKPLKQISLKFLDQGTAYRFYINNSLIAESGIVSDDPTYSKPRSMPFVIPLINELTEFDMIIHISNYANARGGFWQSITIGNSEKINKFRDRSVAMDLLVAGFLLMMGLYHIGLFSLRKKDKSTIWFGIFCLLFSLRTVITGEKYLIYLYPSLPFQLTSRLEYITFYFEIPVFLFFLRSLFPVEVNKKFFYALLFSILPFCLFCLVSEFSFLSSTLIPVQIISILVASYSIYTNILGISHKRLGGKIFLLGFIIFFGSFLNDILYNRNLINTTYISTHGFLAFIFSQSFVLSMRFSKSFALSESLSGYLEKSNHELLMLKEELEIKVTERTRELQTAIEFVGIEKEKSDKLLLNILPEEVAEELKAFGEVKPVYFENISVMFTDFKGFTQIAEGMSAERLIKELDACFTQFDNISQKHRLEKLKTIGDSYMCAGGLPRINKTHAYDICLAAMEIQDFIDLLRTMKMEKNMPFWELRLGIHTGSVMAGVVGEKKFAYDIWGDAVNIASRMESSGTSGRINISQTTYELVKSKFECEYRGKIKAKNKGEIDMYFLNRILPEFSKDKLGRFPNKKFWETEKK